MIVLPPSSYSVLKERIKEVTINNLFARAVIEQHVKGIVFVDDLPNPSIVYLVHPYGMSLLWGNCNNIEFNKQLKQYALNQLRNREQHVWMQAYPQGWDNVLAELFGQQMVKSALNTDNLTSGIIELNTRVNFKFNADNYLKRPKSELANGNVVVETDREVFAQMSGAVVPSKFWDSANDFVRSGKGFTLLHNGNIAATAYSAFVVDNQLEIGIETVEKYRGLGYAETICSHLIDYCLERDLVPVWSCRLENAASYKLAQKLGFEPTVTLPFYRLSN
jgi:RimJ/RimL family protein N-acetyltransferase